MSIWQGKRNSSIRKCDALIEERVHRPAFDLDGAESFNWTDLQSPAHSQRLDMRHVLRHVYNCAAPTGRGSEPNTMLVLATGALGVLAMRRSRQHCQEGVPTHD